MFKPEKSGLRLRMLAAPPKAGGFTSLAVSLGLALAAAVVPGCYSAGDGTDPPQNALYYPVGMAVSPNNDALYVANSDFDLQWNGGTLQAYALNRIRGDVALIMENPDNPNVPHVRGADGQGTSCVKGEKVYTAEGKRQPLGETCAPPIRSDAYVTSSVTIGAFATDLQLSKNDDRVFVPVRGNATLTWASIQTNADGTPRLECGQGSGRRCDDLHAIGDDENEPSQNTRHITTPGEPFGMAQTEIGDAIVMTHQTDTKASLFSTVGTPSLQFVLDGVATGGNGIAAIPHHEEVLRKCSRPVPPPAFLSTSRAVAEVTLLRYYADERSSLRRSFITKEATFPLTANVGGTDSRGILIDPTPRLACLAQAQTCEQELACIRKPARVFIANRSPASLLIGEVGETATAGTGSYDPDRLTIYGNVPLTAGPSRVYLAPIVDRDGKYALRVFIVCFDSRIIFVYNPESQQIENLIRTGSGPFAMAFDRFDLRDVAQRATVPMDVVGTQAVPLRKYSFAYVASFTNSFIQVVDLDNSRINGSTFERVVFTLGAPTPPKGT